MAKYSFEFKKKVVLEYLNGGGGTPYLSKKYGLGSETQVRNWVNAYREFGDEGLMRSRKNTSYSFDFKLHVVELYLSTEVSYQELALTVGMNNPSLINRWVNVFHIAGPDALRPKKKGRKKTLDKPKIDVKIQEETKEKNVAISAEHLKQLEDENLKLRIENAFLKELRRLRLEDEAKMRERRSSSTASEENSD